MLLFSNPSLILFIMLCMITIIITLPITEIEFIISLPNIFHIFFIIFPFWISPLIAEFNSSSTSMSEKTSFVYLFASFINAPIFNVSFCDSIISILALISLEALLI